ncbi:MAG: hypothetical protein WHV44_14920, partial [Anaerolineales bacterium]
MTLYRRFLLALLITTVLFFGALSLLPFTPLQHTLNALMPDGEFESLTAQNARVFRALFAFIALIAALKTWLVIRHWDALLRLPARLQADLRTLYLDLRPRPESRLHLTALTVIMLSALAAR